MVQSALLRQGSCHVGRFVYGCNLSVLSVVYVVNVCASARDYFLSHKTLQKKIARIILLY